MLLKTTIAILSLQICLDRAGFSPSAIDGAWGAKSQSALATYCAVKGLPLPAAPEKAFKELFPDATDLFVRVSVTTQDVASLVSIPDNPAEKAKLPAMGYSTIREMFAERGHVSERMLERLNPRLQWPNPPPGSKILVPWFPPPEGNPRKRPRAASLRVSLSRREVSAFAADGSFLALFPCSIAASKSKLPPVGETHITAIIPAPNYTYTPDFTPKGEKAARHIFPPGPNNPVGTAWIGLNLPGYGIHGTPFPERIGRAESHGCFRLANWNASRLLDLCSTGVPVAIEE